ncbi:ABC transporter substrate-binding protein [Shewanella sp. WXL01]|uniref:substrate-binding periplasmic protein n=1 Tax=Shewanella sp. WXL01 TaxID=2709721 RepID=UPI0014383067|nr:ABC transporter substrate-binding protein [Shewanella sp. WXL01]
MPRGFAVILLLTLLVIKPIALAAEEMKLSMLDWPPFTSVSLPDKGISALVVKQALYTIDIEPEFHHLPWNRAMRLVNSGKQVGYFPEYQYQSEQLIFSDPIGQSPIMLLFIKGKPISWQTQHDLTQYTLGVNTGYINTKVIDDNIASGKQRVELTSTEYQSIQVLLAGRVDAIVIDKHVFEYLKSDPYVKQHIDKLQLDDKILENKHLHIAFDNSAFGRLWRDKVNQGLANIDVQAIVDEQLLRLKAN